MVRRCTPRWRLCLERRLWLMCQIPKDRNLGFDRQQRHHTRLHRRPAIGSGCLEGHRRRFQPSNFRPGLNTRPGRCPGNRTCQCWKKR